MSGRRINDSMGKHVAQTTIKKMIQQGIDVTQATVGVLGLTFKENCPDLRNSRVIDIIEELQDHGITVVAEDCWADDEEILAEFSDIRLDRVSAMTGFDALILAVPHDSYAAMSADDFVRLCNTKAVIADVKSMLGQHRFKQLTAAGFEIWSL